MMPQISVAMATFNGESFLLQQLESINNQTVVPHELVVSDDCSTDDTIKVIEKFARYAKFPVVILNDKVRRGFADNFLNAALACRGGYIMFCDQDDVWIKSKVETVMQEMVKENVALCIHANTLVDTDLQKISPNPENVRESVTLRKMTHEPYGSVFGNAMTFKASLLSVFPADWRPRQPEKNDKFMSHDHWIYQLAAVTGDIRLLDTELVLYRQHSGNAYGVLHRTLRDKIFYALQGPENRYDEKVRLYKYMSELFANRYDEKHISKQAAHDVSGFYRRLSDRYSDKLGAYCGSSFIQRRKSLSKLYLEDKYNLWQPKKMSASFAKDLTIGVMLGNPLYKAPSV